jgi:hypothetical protein
MNNNLDFIFNIIHCTTLSSIGDDDSFGPGCGTTTVEVSTSGAGWDSGAGNGNSYGDGDGECDALGACYSYIDGSGEGAGIRGTESFSSSLRDNYSYLGLTLVCSRSELQLNT